MTESEFQEEMDNNLRLIWQRRSHEVLSDVDTLISAIVDPESSDSNSETWATARFIAHRLIGVVGIMQFEDCIELCRSLNQLMDNDPIGENTRTQRDQLAEIARQIAHQLSLRT